MFTEETREKLLKRIEDYSAEDLAELIKQALDESNIPYKVSKDGNGNIQFSGLE